MLCGSRLMVLRVSRVLEFLGPFVEVSVRVVGVTRHLPDRVRARDQAVVRVTRLDRVVVQVEAALRLRVRRVAEAEAVVHRHQALRVMEAEAGTLSRLTLHREVVRVVDVVDMGVVPLEVRRSLRDRQGHLMTLRTFLTESGSESLRINVVRSVSLRRCFSHSSGRMNVLLRCRSVIVFPKSRRIMGWRHASPDQTDYPQDHGYG